MRHSQGFLPHPTQRPASLRLRALSLAMLIYSYALRSAYGAQGKWLVKGIYCGAEFLLIQALALDEGVGCAVGGVDEDDVGWIAAWGVDGEDDEGAFEDLGEAGAGGLVEDG